MRAEAWKCWAMALLLGAGVLATGCVTLAPPPLSACARDSLPADWPDFASEDAEFLLPPFLACASPAEFLALQERVDMPRLVESLDDWHAVRLGAQGIPREDAARVLNRKRASFLAEAPERYGAARAEVLALFIVHSAHDDDLREILFLLAQDKRLEELLGLLPTLQTALEARGLNPTAHADRDFEWRDVGRGLARAGRDALSSAPMHDGGAGMAFSALRGQLPPAYQEALDAAEKRWMARHFSASNVVLGGLDHLTFGVPLGFYGLLATTGHGAYALARGKYEEATRELAPAALLVAVYAGGKGSRALSEAWEAPRGGTHLLSRLEGVEQRWSGLKETAWRLNSLLGAEGMRELSRYIQASREAGRFVAVGGADAALALHEARGDVARARPLMSRALPGVPGAPGERGAKTGAAGRAAPGAYEAVPASETETSAIERPGSLASLVETETGLTSDVVEARLAAVEFESPGARLPMDVARLERHRPSLEAPPNPARFNPRWREYVDYYEKRLGDVKEGKADKGPLPWDAYEKMRRWFDRGLAFESDMVKVLQADARLPRAQRQFLENFDKPRIERNVGVKKPGPGLRFADVLVIEEGGPSEGPRRVETFSFKSRDLSKLDGPDLKAQLIADAKEALRNYGETLDIRRDSLQPLLREGSQIRVPRVRLIYEGGRLTPEKAGVLREALDAVRRDVLGVEVLFQ